MYRKYVWLLWVVFSITALAITQDPMYAMVAVFSFIMFEFEITQGKIEEIKTLLKRKKDNEDT